jgi:hypothetical protein
MTPRVRALGLAACLAAALPASADDKPAAMPLREINITSDSAPGWLPTVAQSETAERTVRDYLADEDAGRADAAYRRFADLEKSHVSFEDFKSGVARLNAQLGAVIERRIVKVTWTKDSPDAPIPGIYAAVDLVSRFANADRHCGYLILFQSNDGGEFQIMREEANIMDNAAAADIAKRGSAADVDAAWAKLSANCPNYSVPAPRP